MGKSGQVRSLSDQRCPVVASEVFILATRDTGYRNTAAAVAELIDNAIQARASKISVRVYVEPASSSGSLSIAVLDNGGGMDPTALRRALQFGGSERFNDRAGLGRFGMGLPNSSLSQSRRVEVYSWQRGRRPHFTFLDVEDIAARRYDTVPKPSPAVIPAWVSECAAASGTLVVWPACDRLGYRRVSTVTSKLRIELGRIYRYALWGEVQIDINDDPVDAVDPLLYRGPVQPPGAEPVGETLEYEVTTPADPRVTSVVSVRFSLLPVHAWASRSSPEKRRLGVTGRAGVSVVRAGREIDYGWYLMGEKRKENYDDWWRCEIAFEPALDEYFRVTHSKQGVKPHSRLAEMLAPDIERIARQLNSQVRNEFRRVAADSTRTPVAVRVPLSVPAVARVPRMSAARVATWRERQLPPLRRRVARYQIRSAPLTSGRFFVVEIIGEVAVVTLNTNHPFHDSAYKPACLTGSAEQFCLESALLAAARAELSVPQSSDQSEAYVQAWSDALAVFLSAR